MAVIQISKIQQRRGQRLISGMPQLSSGELAWAVDTQELFIGNGSLAEGAPEVSNTRILTEHDDILQLIRGYTFGADRAQIVYAVERSLQSKIDEIEVSIKDFGVPTDGSTDCTIFFERAFAELFVQNTDEALRKVLVIPNGVYLFTNVLRIPSNVIMRGETRDGVILDVNANGITFQSARQTEPLFFTEEDYPENIAISNLTISYTSGQTDLTGVKDSLFNNVKFISNYSDLGSTIGTPVLASQEYDLSPIRSGGSIIISDAGAGDGLFSTITEVFNGGDENENAVTVIDRLVVALNSDITFNDNCQASRLAESLIITALESSAFTAQDISDAFTFQLNPDGSGVVSIFQLGTDSSSGIENVFAALTWTNTLFGTRTTNIEFTDCLFTEAALVIKCIQTQAFETVIRFDRCRFLTCDTAVFIQGRANQINTWTLYDCVFEQIARRAVYATEGTGIFVSRAKIKDCGNGDQGPANPLYPIFEFGTKYGNVIVDSISDRPQASNITAISSKVGFSDSLNGGLTTIANEQYADIQLTPDTVFEPLAVFSAKNRYLIIDYILTLSNNVRKGQLHIVVDDTATDLSISDNYTYSPNLITDPGGAMMTNFEFNAELKDNDEDSGIETVLLTYKNPQSSGLTGTVSFSLAYGV
jgi:hypothetical protein